MASITLANAYMNQLDVIDSLGNDAVLLTRPDLWLECRKTAVSEQLSMLADELRALQNVSTVKRKMQDKNLVAVRYLKRMGTMTDEVIEIMSLQEAMRLLQAEDRESGLGNQVNVWKADGYDVEMVAKAG